MDGNKRIIVSFQFRFTSLKTFLGDFGFLDYSITACSSTMQRQLELSNRVLDELPQVSVVLNVSIKYKCTCIIISRIIYKLSKLDEI